MPWTRNPLSVSCLLILAYGSALAQTAPTLEFDVAAIKPVDPHDGSPTRVAKSGGPGTDAPGFVSYHTDVRRLFMQANGVRSDQVVGPDWIKTETFDITAKVPRGSTTDQTNIMLENLLEDRFSVKLHHETRQFPAYSMTVAKTGLKLEETAYPNASPDAPSSPSFTVDKTGFPVLPKELAAQIRVTWFKNGRFYSTFRAFSMARLAEEVQAALPDFMSSELGMAGVPPRVFDRTGLTAKYDFTLDYEGRGDDASGPSIFSALEKQLGLRMDKISAPEDVIVIDHIEKTPKEN